MALQSEDLMLLVVFLTIVLIYGVAEGSSGSSDSGGDACDNFAGISALQKNDILKKLKKVLEKGERQNIKETNSSLFKATS
eukprot:1009082-Ditylum_brightwellii.AAC.1